MQKDARRGARPRRWLLCIVGGVVGAFACVTPALGADPVEITSLQATCDHTRPGRFFSAPPVDAAHAGVITRLTVASGTAELNDNVVEQGDVVWDVAPALDPGTAPRLFASCLGQPADASFSATFYDRPTAPTTFSGVGNASGSVLGFAAPGTARYVADVQLDAGAVTLVSLDGASGESFAGSGRLALGTLAPGGRALFLTADDGPRPAWSVTIHALPVAVTNLAFDRPAAPPGTPLQARYTTDGDTVVTAVVRNRAGRVVATPAAGVAVGPGQHTLRWETRDPAGRRLREGAYTLTLDTRDPSGETTSTSTRATLDLTPPAIRISSPTVIRNDQAVTGELRDALSGIAAATITDPQTGASVELEPGETTFSYRPAAGWEPGPHQLRVTAVDGAGNQRTVGVAVGVCDVGASPEHGKRHSGDERLAHDARERLRCGEERR